MFYNIARLEIVLLQNYKKYVSSERYQSSEIYKLKLLLIKFPRYFTNWYDILGTCYNI